MQATLEAVLTVIAALVGAPALLALLIDILKWAGVVSDGNAGKVSAVFNLLTLIVVAVVLNFYPHIDVQGADKQLAELVKFGALILQYVIQITATKAAHKLYVHTARTVAAFSLRRITHYTRE